MTHDLDQIEKTILPTDPSFRSVMREELNLAIHKARQAAIANSNDEFLLSLMGLLALPGNGHTRLIPNDAISVLPLRFVSIDSAVRLVDAAPGFSEAIGSELLSINGVPLHEVEEAAEPFLAGTRQRRRVIGPILFVWPSALQRLDVTLGSGTIEYLVRNGNGQINELRLVPADVVPGSTFYPRNEHGKADAAWSPDAFVTIKDFDQLGLLMVLPSFFDSSETVLLDEISEATDFIRSRPSAPLLIDVRGNTGGNFLRTKPLIDAISEGAEERRVGLLIDKFTFSAAIVFVAILKHRIGGRLTLIGEEMGDGLTFFAEGGTTDLTSSRACVRYSTAFHDWAGGRIDATTPTEIAEEIVSVGRLELDRHLVENRDDIEAQDEFFREILESLDN